MFIVIATPHQQQPVPPIVQNCEYQVRIGYDQTYKCMDETEYLNYRAEQDKPKPMPLFGKILIGFTIGLIGICILGVMFG